MRAMPTTIVGTPQPLSRSRSPRSRLPLPFGSHRRVSTRVASPIGPDLSPGVITPPTHPDPFPSLAKGAPLPEGYGEPPSAPPKHRRAGIILHPTSLPGPYGIGEIGEEAFRFVDWLVASGQQIWQVGLAAEGVVAPCADAYPCVHSCMQCMPADTGWVGGHWNRETGPAGPTQGPTQGIWSSPPTATRPPPYTALPSPPFLQLLPLCPPETEYWSPYSGLDALCGNPLLIPLDGLVDLGLLRREDLPAPSPPGNAGLPPCLLLYWGVAAAP